MRNRVAARVDLQPPGIGNRLAVDHGPLISEKHEIPRDAIDPLHNWDDMARAGRRGLEVGSPEGKPGEVQGDAGGNEITSTNLLGRGEIEKIQTKRLGVGDVDHDR